MKYRVIGFGLIILSVILVCLSGCSEGDERRHPLFIQGSKARENNDAVTAVAHFKALWQRRPNAVYLHLELAGIYDEMLNEPLKAIIHYQLYLDQMPDSNEKDTVLKWQQQAEKQLYKSLQSKFADKTSPPPVTEETPAEKNTSGNASAMDSPSDGAPAETPVSTQSGETAPAVKTPETAALQQELAATRQQLEQYKIRMQMLRTEVGRLRQAANIDPTRRSSATVVQTPPGATAARTYTVQSGDTPGRIARKFYGKSSLYPVIMRANPKINARNLRPGMVLEIPPLQP